MESRVKFFKTFLIITIFSDAAFSLLNYYLLTKYIPEGRTDASVLLLVSSITFFLIAAIVVLILLKKYPSQSISNTTEGLVFTFAIVTFLLTLVDLFLIYGFAYIALNVRKIKEHPITPALLFVSVSSVITIACAIFIAINSLRLLRIIRRNRWNLAQEIKNIGTNYE